MAVALAAACPFASKDGKGLLLEIAPLEGAGVRCIDLGTRDSWVRAFPLLKFEIKIFLAKELTNGFAHLSQKLWRFFFKSSSLLMKSQSLLWTFYIFIISLELQSQFQSKLIWEILLWRSSQWTVFKLGVTLPSKRVANVHILKLLKTSWNILQKLWRIFFRAKYQVILKPISWTGRLKLVRLWIPRGRKGDSMRGQSLY